MTSLQGQWEGEQTREGLTGTGYFDPMDIQAIYKCKHPSETSNITFAWKTTIFLSKPHLASLGWWFF